MWYRKLTILDFETPLAATAETTRDDAVTARGNRAPARVNRAGGYRVRLQRAGTRFTRACGGAVTAAVTV